MEDQMPTMLVNYLVKRRWLSAVTKVMVFKMWERVFAEVRFRRSALTLQCWWRQVQARKERQSLATQARVAYLAKRGFVWLLQQVKVKRAQLLLQTQ
ncbi:hypothetical protein AaE_006455, partial [Aphanomyces astaci]